MHKPSEAEAIRELAYHLWLARGQRHGYAQDDWLDAEREILGGREPTSVNGAQPKKRKRRARAPEDASRIPRTDLTSGEQPETPKVSSRDAPGG
jgi:Protein of unknown function (DUF2934)